MSCAHNTWSSAAIVPAHRRTGGNRPAFLRTITLIVEAFQEALEMRRAAHKQKCFLDD